MLYLSNPKYNVPYVQMVGVICGGTKNRGWYCSEMGTVYKDAVCNPLLKMTEAVYPRRGSKSSPPPHKWTTSKNKSFPPLHLFLSPSVSHSAVPLTLSTVSPCPVWRSALQESGGGKMTVLFYVNAKLHVYQTANNYFARKLITVTMKKIDFPKNHFKGNLKGRMKNRLFIATEMLCWQEQKPWEGSVWECVCALLCTEQMRNPKWDLYTLLTMNLFFHGCYDFRKENSDLYKSCM